MSDEHVKKAKRKKIKRPGPKKGMEMFRFLNRMTNWITVDSLKLYDEDSRLLRQSSDSSVCFDQFVTVFGSKRDSCPHKHNPNRFERKLLHRLDGDAILPVEANRRGCRYTQYDDVMLLEKQEDLEEYDLQEQEDGFCHMTEVRYHLQPCNFFDRDPERENIKREYRLMEKAARKEAMIRQKHKDEQTKRREERAKRNREQRKQELNRCKSKMSKGKKLASKSKQMKKIKEKCSQRIKKKWSQSRKRSRSRKSRRSRKRSRSSKKKCSCPKRKTKFALLDDILTN
uniref:Uncharacterized protein n=1 Tax=Cacopsylla melanoneura TaxID=428564 RepID=A0A8D9BNF6_9HEMI